MQKIDFEQDFYAWTQQQAQFLKNRQLDRIDWTQIAEEIEDMGRSEKRQLASRLEVLVMHLLKWQFQPNLRSRSWELTIKEQRLRLNRLLEENPSLRSNIETVLTQSYPLAVVRAEQETGLSNFPAICPYSLKSILSEQFYPFE